MWFRVVATRRGAIPNSLNMFRRGHAFVLAISHIICRRMVEALQAWLSDGTHLALLAGGIVLLYLARDAAHRLLRAAFLLAAHMLRLIERWVGFGATSANARYERLTAGMKEGSTRGRPMPSTREGRGQIADLSPLQKQA